MVSFSRTRGALIAALLLLAVVSTAARAQTTFSNTSGITIDSVNATQGNPYPSYINVSGLTSTTAKVTVTLLGLTHTDAYHLQFLVEDPTGHRLMIFSDVSNNSNVSNINVTLDDAAGSSLPDMSGALTAGTFKPTSHFSPLDMPVVCSNCPVSGPAGANTLGSTFNGLDPNGSWKLYVYDWVAGNGGSLTGWNITITTSAGLATTTTVASSLNPSWTTGTVTLTATVREGTNTVTQGTVTFVEGATTLAGPITLNVSGQASSGALTLAEGAHVITAQYNGAGGYSPSVGQITQVVNTPTTRTGNKFCNTGTIAIPKPPGSGVDTGDPANPYPSNIFVSGLTGTTSKVTVDFTGFAHAYPSHVDMILVSPLGDRSLLLWSDVGGGTSVSSRNVTLDDSAVAPLPDSSTTLATGTYQPTARNYRTNHTFPAPAPQTPSLAAPRGTDTLAVFNGIDPNGNWKLYVVDGAMGQTGSITGGWCATFTLSSDAATTTAVSSSLNPSFTGNSITFTATVTSSGSAVTTGTVTFTEGSTVLQGPVGLDESGQATFTTSSLGEGRRRITANYSGVPGSFNVSAGYVDQQIDDATQVTGTQFCNTADTGAVIIPATGTSIGPAAQYPLRFFVSNLPGTVNTLSVSMNGLQYSSPVALQMMLVGPGGTAAHGLDFFSHASNTTAVSGIDLTFADTASTAVPSTALISGTYLPTSTTAGNTWDAPAPAGPYQFAAPAGAHTLTSAFGNTDANGVWSLYVASTTNGTSGVIAGPACLTFTQNAPDLTISKGHGGDFRQGEIGAEYTITVTNDGPGSSGGTVTVTDTLPADLTATAMTGTGWTCTLATLTCTRGDALAAGSSYPPITLTVDVAGAAPASVTNTAAVSGGGDTTPLNNTASDATTVTAAADLTITKSHAGDFSQGQTGASYTITVTNTGLGATIAPVTVVENPPAALTLTGLSGDDWACDVPGRSCNRSDVLGAGTSYPAITATFDVAASAPSSVSNAAAVSGGGQTNTTNDSATDSTTIIQKPDLTIAKSHTGSFRQGQTGAEYTITVTNSGGSPTSGTVTVTDTLPAGLTATAIGGTGWTCNLGTLSCTSGDALANGSSYPAIVVAVNVAENASASVTNEATVSGGGELNAANNTASDATTVVQVADLTVTKTHTGNFTQGQTGAQYAITVTNSGSGPTDADVTVTDTLPSGLTATAMSGTGWNCVLGTLTCTRSDALAAGASFPAITLTVDVATNALASVTNSATVAGGGEIDTGNNSASDPATIIQLADLTVVKSHTGSFRQGQTGVAYNIVVTNAGNGVTAGTVTVTDTLPVGLTATGMSGTGWTCTAPTCTRSDALVPGGSYPPITLTVDVAANAAATVTNTVAVSGGGEVITTNDTASDPTTVVQVADLEITKFHAGNFRQGQNGATYTLVVINSGPGPTDTAVTVTDTLPPGLSAAAMGGTGWTCNLGTLTCTRSDVLASGTNYPAITLTVNVAANAPASVTNQAAVSGGGEINTGNNTADDITTVDQAADMSISKTHAGSFTQGQTGAHYTITVSNSGPGPTVGVVSLTDALPTGLSATGMSGAGWGCTLATLTCTRSDVLAPGGSYEAITLSVNVAANAPASVTNSVTVSGGGELDASNNSATDPTTVIQLADLTVTKSHAGDFRQGQTGATYNIVVTNAGNGVTAGMVTITDTLPAGLTATGMSGAGWTCTAPTCTRSDALAPGGSYPPITLTVDVAAVTPAAVTNTVVVSGGGEIITTNDTASDPTVVVQLPDLAITKSHAGSFRQGQNGAAYTLVVTNSGPGPTDAPVTVTDTLPAGLTATAIGGTGWTCNLGTLSCTRSDVLASAASYPAIFVTVNVAANAPANVTNSATVSTGDEPNLANNTVNDQTTIVQVADMTVIKTHAGSFTQGQTGAQYAIGVSNVGPGGPTVGVVSVTDALPGGLTATAMSGSGWSCALATLTCTRSDTLDTASSYPPIWLTVNVAANAPANVTNSVSVSGGGELETGNNSSSNPTAIVQLADLTIAKTHAGAFEQGQIGAQYAITVTNAGNGATTAPVVVADTLPAGLTATAIGGAGWMCTLATLTCTRADVLAPAASYPPIAVTVDVAAGAPTSVVNRADVSGGGEVITTNNTVSDTTLIGQIADLRAAKSHAGNFRQRQAGAVYTIVVTNAGTGPTAGAVSVTDTLPAGLTATAMSGAGWTCSLPALNCTRADALAAGASYPAVTVAVNVAASAAPLVVNNIAVSGGGEAVTDNNTAADPTVIDQVVDITVSTSPAGLKVSVDGIDYPDGHRFEWIPGSAHTLGPGASIEEPPGTRHVLVSWSDGGTSTHTITTPGVATTYTAKFGLQYVLTPAASPPEGGSVTPAYAWYYNAGSTVPIGAEPKPGFAFAGWTGPVKDPRSPTTQVVMSGPVAVTAKFERPTGEQTIAFPPIPDKAASDAQFVVTATATSGLPVAFRIVSGPARISGNLITLIGIGTVTVEASQSGDETHPPAVPVTRSFRVLETAPVFTACAIVDAASYRQSISPGSLASVFGNNLAPGTAQAASLPLPLSLAGTWVTIIDSAGVSYSAQLLYVSGAQVNFVVPEGVATGPARILIANDSGRTVMGMIEIAQVAPALFSVDMTGRGLAAAIFTRLSADGTVVALPTFELTPDGRIAGVPIDLGGPADRVFLSLFGTGIRGVAGLSQVTASAGGLPAMVHYAGRQPEYAGLDQVNIELPRALAGRGEIGVTITVQGRASNAVTVVIR